MDPGNIGQHRTPQVSHKIELDAAAQTSSTSSSELGRIAQDIGSVVTKWQGRLHSALEDWKGVTEEIQEIIDSVQQSVSIYKNLKAEYTAILNDPQRVQSGTSALTNRLYDFKSAQVDNVLKLLSFLGIPPSAINVQGSTPSGYSVAISAQQYISMFNLIQETIVEKAADGTLLPNKGAIQGEVANLKSEQTRDMFKVMACFTAVRENEESETSTLDSLASMISQIMQAIE